MKIKSIEKVSFNGPVYNFHCLPNENYFSEGILVHNCYKSNDNTGSNMSFETYKKLATKFPKTVGQIAFGIGNIYDFPELWQVAEHTRELGIIPNVTTNGWNLGDYEADMLKTYMGAVAVSHYDDDVCFDAIKKLTDRGMTQINIHKMVSKNTLKSCFQLIEKAQNDPRLEKLNAIVFLMLKPKGRGTSHNKVQNLSEYKELIDAAFKANINIGFDSCSCENFLLSVRDHSQYKTFEQLSDPCESTLFSGYIDVNCNFYPCSFCEEIPGWETGINVLECNDFVQDVWLNPRVNEFRKALLQTTKNSCIGCRSCPIYDLKLEDDK